MSDIEKLLEIMAALRDPQNGCPWDLEQDFSTIAPFTVEEAYEVADAIARRDHAELRNELGDLLLQVVFHAQMAAEAGLFDSVRLGSEHAGMEHLALYLAAGLLRHLGQEGFHAVRHRVILDVDVPATPVFCLGRRGRDDGCYGDSACEGCRANTSECHEVLP